MRKGKDKDSSLSIQQYDERGDPIILFAVPREEKYQEKELSMPASSKLAVNSKNDVYILNSRKERGHVSKYSAKGEKLKEWEIVPYPLTSVSYVNDIQIDRKDNVYVGWSSWEACASQSNCGGIFKYNPDGELILHIYEDISVLSSFSVSKEGDIYLYDLGDEIKKYSSMGKPVLQWNAVPPQYGETWQEKQRRERITKGISKDSNLADLCMAFAYSEDENQMVLQWILGQKPHSFPELIHEMLKWRTKDSSYLFTQVISEYIQKYSKELQKTVMDVFHTSNEEVQTLLLPIISNYYESIDDPALARLANKLSREEKDTELTIFKYDLENETVDFYLNRLSKLSPDDRDYFDAVWPIQQQIMKPQLLIQVISILKDTKHPLRAKIQKIFKEISPDDLENSKTYYKKPITPLINAMKELLKDPDAEIRDVALSVLTKANAVSADMVPLDKVPKNDTEKRVSACAIVSFLYQGNHLEKDQWLTFIKNINSIQNEEDMQEVSKCLYSKVEVYPHITILSSIMKEITSGVVKFSALASLNAIYYEEVMELYQEALSSSIPDEQKVQLCSRLFFKPNAKCKSLVLHALRNAGPHDDINEWLSLLVPNADDESADLLLNLYTKSNKTVQANILWNIAQMGGNQKWQDTLYSLLDDPDQRIYASLALARMGDGAGLQGALDGMKQFGFYSRLSTAYNAEVFRSFMPGVITELKKLLEYPNEFTKQFAVQMLIELHDESTIQQTKKSILQELTEKHAMNPDQFCNIIGEDPAFFDEILKVAADKIAKGISIELLGWPFCDHPEPLFDNIERHLITSPDANQTKFMEMLLQHLAPFDLRAKTLLIRLSKDP